MIREVSGFVRPQHCRVGLRSLVRLQSALSSFYKRAALCWGTPMSQEATGFWLLPSQDQPPSIFGVFIPRCPLHAVGLAMEQVGRCPPTLSLWDVHALPQPHVEENSPKTIIYRSYVSKRQQSTTFDLFLLNTAKI